MRIRDMFFDDINRTINGVIKVDQSGDDVIFDEIKEYVITAELKKHFMSFFNYYCDAFSKPTTDMGVWISGFFGSGKSHFLKMLSYLLENREVRGIKTVDQFRAKFEDDPATFMMIDRATRGKTETILFNIDVEGSINKDSTAVLRVFAKMFYNHLGYYGDSLKVSLLEHHVHQQGKTQAFREAYKNCSQKEWTQDRKAFAFRGQYIVPALMKSLGMSEEDAKAWFLDKRPVEYSIARLVDDIKEYVSHQPADYRLLFMIDEAGQYVGTDTNMLLNLQSLTEKLGSECQGKVWVFCTGQEAIDQIIKVRVDEFSRIQARFKARLSLSSSSVDEVIQKRILKKKPEVTPKLEAVYNNNDSVLRNLFSFTDSILDIKGYTGPVEFSANYPFVPYQFIIIQKVFAEIRKHGNAGQHLSGRERSMLSGFQEAAQKIQESNEYALVPFFLFYDTVHSFLDGAIRRVIERCQRAADSGDGIEARDVDVLKLLFLVRYVDDIKASLDNIVILMADDIRTDKIENRASIAASLNRLISQNYIARTGDTYNFLTDEEQDIQQEIKITPVDTAAIVVQIGQIIFGDLYTAPKYRFGKYDFSFDKMVDGTAIGVLSGGMVLRFLSVTTDAPQKSDFHLIGKTKGREAAVVLAETPYYESLENAMKIRKFIQRKNVSQMPQSMQNIIREQQDEAGRYEQMAKEELRRAISEGIFFADGEKLDIKGGDAKAKVDQALEYLVSHVYSDLDLITWNAESDADILAILNGNAQDALAYGMTRNQAAADKMFEYLEMQDERRLPTSMADVQSRFSAIPYGWREIDIAAVAAKLIFEQRVTVKYAGNTIQPDNPRLVDMLRKKSEIGKTVISKRHVLSFQKLKASRVFLRAYFDVMDVPDDEDGMMKFIIERFTEAKQHYTELAARYQDRQYPDKTLVDQGLTLIQDVLSQQKDNEALVSRLLNRQDALEDNKEDLAAVEAFFATQVDTFDRAVRYEKAMYIDLDYIARDEATNTALNSLRAIITLPTSGRYNYKRIPELNSLMDTVSASHDRMLETKREELMEVVRQCIADIHQRSDGNMKLKNQVVKADDYYVERKERVAKTDSLALLDGMMPLMWAYKDKVLQTIEALTRPPESKQPDAEEPPVTPKPKLIKPVYRQSIFPAKRLLSEVEINAYVEQMRTQLLAYMQGSDGIELM